jgi:hypothetical protein
MATGSNMNAFLIIYVHTGTYVIEKEFELFYEVKTTPSVFGSSDRTWIDFVNKITAQYWDKRRSSAATLEHHPNGESL